MQLTPLAVIEAANLGDTYLLQRCECDGHVWFYGPYTLRLSAPGVLEDEARLLRFLPKNIPHAPLVAAGDGWLVQRRVAGEPLRAVWRSLPEETQRAATQQLAAILMNLHGVRLSGSPALSPGWFAAILPADIIRLATQLRDYDPPLFDAVIRFTRRTMAEIKPPLRWGLIHRDLHFDHVLWNGNRITALLDFERAVNAPRELELDTLLRFCRNPAPGLHPDDLEALPGWLEEDYPYLFGEPGLERRLRLYSVEHYLRRFAEKPEPTALDYLRAEIGE